MGRKLYKSLTAKEPGTTDYLKDVWRNRALLLTFAFRDLRLQYAQTYLGILWSIVQPLTGLLIFYFFFQRVMHLEIGVPYTVFAFTGMLGWFYFTQLVGQAGTVLMHNQHLIRKIHFPRLILPLAKVLNGLTEFLISLALLFVLMLATGYPFSWRIVFLPLAIAANVIAGLSVGIWLCALTIRFRDMHHLIPYLVGFGIWLTPVFYPTTIVPGSLNWLYYFHAPANVIALYRCIFLGWEINIPQVVCSLSISFVLLLAGLRFFIKNEKFIADRL